MHWVPEFVASQKSACPHNPKKHQCLKSSLSTPIFVLKKILPLPSPALFQFFTKTWYVSPFCIDVWQNVVQKNLLASTNHWCKKSLPPAPLLNTGEKTSLQPHPGTWHSGEPFHFILAHRMETRYMLQ